MKLLDLTLSFVLIAEYIYFFGTLFKIKMFITRTTKMDVYFINDKENSERSKALTDVNNFNR